MPADGGQLRAGGVGQLVLPHNGVGDGVLQKSVGGEGAEQMGDGGLFLPRPVVGGGPGRSQNGGDLQQLPGVQAAPHVRPLEAGGHRLDARKAGGPPEDQQFYRCGGLLLGPFYVVDVVHGAQLPGPLPALVGDSTPGQQLQHPGQLQGGHGFFK